jgi:hypothetical protein
LSTYLQYSKKYVISFTKQCSGNIGLTNAKLYRFAFTVSNSVLFWNLKIPVEF